jgi:hypothetical protein
MSKPIVMRERTEGMRHDFKEEFDKMYDYFFHKQQAEKKKDFKYKDTFAKYHAFRKVYYSAESKFLKDDLKTDGFEVSSSSSDSSDCSSHSSRS